jgi:hypothetical protein
MYFLNGFIEGFLFGVTAALIGKVPSRPEDKLCRLASGAGFYMGLVLGAAFLIAVFLWLHIQTG